MRDKSYRILLRQIFKLGKFFSNEEKYLCTCIFMMRQTFIILYLIQFHRNTRESRLSVCFTLLRGSNIYDAASRLRYIAISVISISTDSRFAPSIFRQIFSRANLTTVTTKKTSIASFSLQKA